MKVLMIFLMFSLCISCDLSTEEDEDGKKDTLRLSENFSVGEKEEKEEISTEEKGFLLKICNSLVLKNLNGMEKDVIFKEHDCDGKVKETSLELIYESGKGFVSRDSYNNPFQNQKPYYFREAVTTTSPTFSTLCERIKNSASEMLRYNYQGVAREIVDRVTLRKNSRSCYLGNEKRSDHEDEYCLEVVRGTQTDKEGFYQVYSINSYVIVPQNSSRSRAKVGQVKYQYRAIGSCSKNNVNEIYSERLIL